MAAIRDFRSLLHKEASPMRWLMKRSFLVVLLAGLSAGVLGLPGPAAAAENKVEVGKPAPPIDLPATNIGKVLPGKKSARTISLRNVKGKNVVVYFFPKSLTRG
jgi:hypothetical protein